MPGPIRNTAAVLNETVVKPAADEVGKAIEQGVQSITGSNQKPVNPQDEARKEAETQRKRQNIIQFLNNYNADYQRRQAQLTREQQEKAALQQQESKEKQEEALEEQEKSQSVTLAQQQAKARSERRGGVGG